MVAVLDVDHVEIAGERWRRVQPSQSRREPGHTPGVFEVGRRQRHPLDEADDERLGLEDPGENRRSHSGGGGEHGVVVFVVAIDAELAGLADADPDDVSRRRSW